MGEAFGALDGMEESLGTNVGIVAMWNSILRSKEKREVNAHAHNSFNEAYCPRVWRKARAALVATTQP